ncbi:polysaccharide lyase family 14 protein [Backusella circina FSU 941]|nr:polysaccharide lyase family 14 protein [Backusella circina FSU 941]
MPLDDTPPNNTAQYLSSNWHTTNKKIYGGNGLSFVNDPIDKTKNLTVLKVEYPSGSYAPIGSRSKAGIAGGVEFFSSLSEDNYYNSALLSYDIAFDSSFRWIKGGKLPGIYGGPPGIGCSGGGKATGSNCFSVRLMWRDGGAGEAYAYIPTTDELCKSKEVICNSDYGTSFSRGVIQFSTHKWSRLEIYVRMNSRSDTNGILQVWQDGNLVIDVGNLKYRSSEDIGISSLMFSTFFGGGTPDYATHVDTASYFKNIQYSTGNVVLPENSGSSSFTISRLLITCLTVFTGLFLYNV